MNPPFFWQRQHDRLYFQHPNKAALLPSPSHSNPVCPFEKPADLVFILMLRLAFSQRSFTAKLIIVGGLITFLLSIYTLHPSSATLRDSVSGIFSIKQPSECSPELWSSGQWKRRMPPRTYKENATSLDDVLEMEGFVGCASDREYRWHLGSEEDQWPRFPEVAAYEWTPPAGCNARQFDREDVIRDMVEKGGWLLLGGKCLFSFIPSFRPASRSLPSATIFAPVVD